jgi:hypothetical protein
MESAHLNFLKNMLEGNNSITFSAWFKNHEAALKQCLPRAQFLRLKFNPTDEACALLAQHNIQFTTNALAVKNERFLLTWHASFLDDNGYVKQEQKAKLYEGAIGLLMQNDMAAGKKSIEKQLKNISKKKLPARANELEEMLGFAEIEFTLGDTTIGNSVLQSIAAMPMTLSYADEFILRAQNLLATSLKNQPKGNPCNV